MIPTLYPKIILCTAFLFYASYSDVKYRIVRNKVWKVMLPMALSLVFVDLVTHEYNLGQLITSFIMIFILLLIVTIFKTIGPADAKLLMIFSLLFPTQPTIPVLSNVSPPLFTLSLFCNAILITAIWFLIFYLHKLIDKNYQIPKDVPFMVSISIAFPITLIIGDVLWWVVHPLYCMISF